MKEIKSTEKEIVRDFFCDTLFYLTLSVGILCYSKHLAKSNPAHGIINSLIIHGDLFLILYFSYSLIHLLGKITQNFHFEWCLHRSKKDSAHQATGICSNSISCGRNEQPSIPPNSTKHMCCNLRASFLTDFFFKKNLALYAQSIGITIGLLIFSEITLWQGLYMLSISILIPGIIFYFRICHESKEDFSYVWLPTFIFSVFIALLHLKLEQKSIDYLKMLMPLIFALTLTSVMFSLFSRKEITKRALGWVSAILIPFILLYSIYLCRNISPL